MALLDALRASRLYRPDQAELSALPRSGAPPFPGEEPPAPGGVAASALLSALVADRDERIVRQDADGGVHFHADFRNARALAGRSTPWPAPATRELAAAERASLLELYERVFDHQSFTGRSGSFFKYEGLGCIYWHMVSKLLVAVQEVLDGERARPDAAEAEARLLPRLRAHYHAIREGLGVHKPPAVHGAFPIDPYSHTPGPRRRPAARADRAGQGGHHRPPARAGGGGGAGEHPLRAGPAAAERAPAGARPLRLPRPGRPAGSSLALPEESLAFTLCQVPVVYRPAERPQLAVTQQRRHLPAAWRAPRSGPSYPGRCSTGRGEIRRIEVWMPVPPDESNPMDER